jgi:hypothetical protein
VSKALEVVMRDQMMGIGTALFKITKDIQRDCDRIWICWISPRRSTKFGTLCC